MSKRRKSKKAIGGLFTELDRRDRLSEIRTPLDKLNETVDFEIFRSLLEKFVPRKPRDKGGRRPFDHVFMFKILVLQSYYGLSDEAAEFEILDRTSFKRFLDIEKEGDIPDRTTIWTYREALGKKGAEALFDRFHEVLAEAGIIGRKGRIVDASFVEAPRRRNTREENEQIKDTGEPLESWSENQRAQKDIEAQWTRKRNETHFGYKNHISVDEESKLIDRQMTTPANVHDSSCFDSLIKGAKIGRVHADSAYSSKQRDQWLEEQGIKSRIHEKAQRNSPLNGNQKRSNKAKSRIRARVEHIFGFHVQVMKGNRIRTIGLDRACRNNAIKNLTYNIARAYQLGWSM